MTRPEVTEEMIEAGLAAYGGFTGGNPRSHGELCRDIYTAMHKARPVEEGMVERVAQVLQDTMEQYHGVCLKASEWDAVASRAIAAIGDKANG